MNFYFLPRIFKKIDYVKKFLDDRDLFLGSFFFFIIINLFDEIRGRKKRTKHFSYLFIGRVMFKTKTGELKEEFWEDKKLGEEELVKMGKIDNFQSLRGSLKRPKRKPHLEIQHLLPETRTRGAKREHIHES